MSAPVPVQISEEKERGGWTIDNFPIKLRRECLKTARNRDMTLTQFAEKWMRIGLEQEKAILEAEGATEMKTDKRQFGAVLKRMLEKPPQKTAEIEAPIENRPKPVRPPSGRRKSKA